MRYKQQTPTEQSTEDINKADKVLRANKSQRMQRDWSRKRQQTQTEQASKDADGANNLYTVDADRNKNINADKVDNLDIDIKGAIKNDDNGNTKIRRPKIISFSINNIKGYSYSI